MMQTQHFVVQGPYIGRLRWTPEVGANDEDELIPGSERLNEKLTKEFADSYGIVVRKIEVIPPELAPRLFRELDDPVVLQVTTEPCEKLVSLSRH